MRPATIRILSVLLFGFSSGIPNALTGSTLQAWMKSEKVDLATIGLFSLLGLPYACKFLWSPLMDRYVPPFLGRRRGWILLCQLALVPSIVLLGFSSPSQSSFLTASLAMAVAFSSASQDIVADAYRTDLLPDRETGPGASAYILGYRVAMLVSGALALILADRMAWRWVYLLMAATIGVGMVTSFLAPGIPGEHRLAPPSLKEAIVQPFVEFLGRRGALEILLFLVIYKIDIVVATALTTPFLMEIGFSMTDIGLVTKGFGLISTILGTVMGGALMVRLGMKRSLWVFGLLQGIAGGSFMLLARLGHDYPAMVAAIAAENFCSGLSTTATAAFYMTMCDKRYTATQYALLTSIAGLARILGGTPTGYLAKAVGWQSFFLISVLVSIPGLLLLLRFDHWQRGNSLPPLEEG